MSELTSQDNKDARMIQKVNQVLDISSKLTEAQLKKEINIRSLEKFIIEKISNPRLSEVLHSYVRAWIDKYGGLSKESLAVQLERLMVLADFNDEIAVKIVEDKSHFTLVNITSLYGLITYSGVNASVIFILFFDLYK